jgi:LmbE family N-acetylglucosaminyl deacetylase
MKLYVGSPRALLVIAPHPDDETIGAFGLMTLLRAQGVKVRILVVSDGCGSHRASPSWPRARLTQERRRETRLAVRRIGINAGSLRFLGLPDGDLTAQQRLVGRLIGREISRAPKPLLVVAPGATDDHPDHRAVAAGVASLRAAGVRRLTYPVWPAGLGLPGARKVQLNAQRCLAKRHAIRGYRTQTGRIHDDPAGFTMTPVQIAAFARPSETFVAV